MALTFQQTDTASSVANLAYCSNLAVASSADTVRRVAQVGGTAGVTEAIINHTTSIAGARALIYFECPVPANTQWHAGTWTVRLNVTTANAQLTLTSIFICRLSSANSSLATIGSATGLSVKLSGTTEQTVTGVAQTPNAGDKVLIICGISNGQTMENTAGLTPSATIDSPFGQIGGGSEASVSVGAEGAGKRSSVGGQWPAYRAARLGPYAIGGTLYAFSVIPTDGSSQNGGVRAYKSTDDGATWTAQDVANEPTTGALSTPQYLDVVLVGSDCYALFGAGANGNIARIQRFSGDAWIELESGMTTSPPTATANASGSASAHLAVRGTGDYVVVHQGPTETISTIARRRALLSRFSGGAWVAPIDCTPTGIAVDYDIRGAILGDASRVHFLFSGFDSAASVDELAAHTLKADNTLAPANLTPAQGGWPYMAGTPALRNTGSGLEVVAPYRTADLTENRYPSDDTPTWGTPVVAWNGFPEVEDAPPAVAVINGSITHIVYTDVDTRDLHLVSDSSSRTWGASELLATALVEGMSATLVAPSTLGVLYRDAGVTRFLQHALPTPGQGGSEASLSVVAEGVKPANGSLIAKETGTDGNNATQNVDVCGADLGVLIDAAWDSSLTFIVFGDTSGCPMDTNWRSQTIALTTDQNPSDGITFDSWITDAGGDAKELIAQDAGTLTIVPTGGVSIGNDLYLYLQQVIEFQGATWTGDLSKLYKSTDQGENWTQVTGVTWTHPSNFNQLHTYKEGGFVYLFGLIFGRLGGVRLARVSEANIETKSLYEYWDGATWQVDNEAAAVEIIPATVGEMSIAWSGYLGQYICLYMSENTAKFELRRAPALTGPWSLPQIILHGFDFPCFYAPYTSNRYVIDDKIYFRMSRFCAGFDPYSTYWMSVDLVSSGTKHASGGSTAAVDTTAQGAGEKAGSGQSEATVNVSAQGIGQPQVGGGTEAVVSVTTDGQGAKRALSGSEASLAVSAEGSGIKVIPAPVLSAEVVTGFVRLTWTEG